MGIWFSRSRNGILWKNLVKFRFNSISWCDISFFHFLIMGSLFLALNVQFGGLFFRIEIFKIKLKIIKYRLLWCLEVAKLGDNYWNWMFKICKKWRIFQKFWKIFAKLLWKSSKYSIHRCLEGAKLLPIPNSDKATKG